MGKSHDMRLLSLLLNDIYTLLKAEVNDKHLTICTIKETDFSTSDRRLEIEKSISFVSYTT
jgi:hypothetical protein